MRTILTLMRKDFANFFRDRTALILTFLIPVMLIYIFGLVFGINRKDSGPTGIRLAIVNESDNPAAEKIIDTLRHEKTFRVVTNNETVTPERPLVESDLKPLMHRDEFRYAVVIPKDLIPDDRIGIRLKILSNARNDVESQTVQGLLQRNLFAAAPELLGQSLQNQAKRFLGQSRFQQFNDGIATAIANAFGGDKEAIARRLAEGNFGFGAAARSAPDPKDGKDAPKNDLLSSLFDLGTEKITGQTVRNQRATGVVGGWAIMFLLFALSASAMNFFEEKKTGIFARLLSAPVYRAQLLWSRFFYGVLLGLMQLTALFFAGYLLYDIDIFSHFGNLVIMCIAAAMACTSVGMLLAAVSPTAQAAEGLATFVILMMSATGGAWFPVSFMPEFMQHVAKFTIVYWSMEGFAHVLWEGQTFTELLPLLSLLLAIAAATMGVAIWLFNRRRLFE